MLFFDSVRNSFFFYPTSRNEQTLGKEKKTDTQEKETIPNNQIHRLYDGELGGSDIESVDVGGQPGEGLLGSVGSRRKKEGELSAQGRQSYISGGIGENQPDQGVDLDTVNVVELLDRVLDLPLVCLDVDNEDKGVVLLNLLHGGLGVQGVDNDLVLVEPGNVGNALAGVLWVAGQREGLWAVEGSRETDLAGNLGVSTLEGGLLRIGSLLAGGGLGT